MNYIELSKKISYALRHNPKKYELELDEEGYVSIDKLLDSLNKKNKYEREIVKEDIEHIIEISDKKRLEIIDNKIRALYGHSIINKIIKEKAIPPNILYHGTAHKFIDSILKNGLLPKSRQYVHLSLDIETAIDVGKRRDNNPILLEIDAKRAYQDGISFYKGNDKVWLSDTIPPKYIRIKE